MRQLMIDDPTFVVAWGAETKPLLIESSHGVEIRMQQGAASASHVDHTLASLAEVGTSLDHPLTTRDRTTRVQSLLNHAIGDFSLNQLEYEWTTLALALYAPNAEPWQSKEGQSIDFNVLAKRIMRQRFSQGVCYGNHRLYTLTILLRIDDEYGILTTETRDEILQHLTLATQTLVAQQSLEGYWDATWAQDGRIEEDGRLSTDDEQRCPSRVRKISPKDPTWCHASG